MDANDDGEVDLAEMKAYLTNRTANLGGKVSDADIAAAFARADTDNGGTIDFPEFCRIYGIINHGPTSMTSPSSFAAAAGGSTDLGTATAAANVEIGVDDGISAAERAVPLMVWSVIFLVVLFWFVPRTRC
jgi:hypothetical protein